MGQATLQGVNNAPQTNGAGVTETKVGAKVGLDVNVIGQDSSFEKTILSATGSVSSNTKVVTCPTGKRVKVCVKLLETAYSAGAITPIFTDGNGGATLTSSLLQAISGTISGDSQAVAPPGWLFATSAGNDLYFNPNGQTVNYAISYFTDDAS